MVRFSDVIGVSILAHLTYTVSFSLYEKLKKDFKDDKSIISRISSISSISSIQSIVNFMEFREDKPRPKQKTNLSKENKAASKIQKCWLSRKRDILEYEFL